MERRRGLTVAVGAALLGAALTAFPAWPAGAAAGQAAASSALCSSSSHPALAARIGRDIQAARRGRVSTVAVAVDDPGLGLECWLNRFSGFDSASVVKVTILAALLHKAEDQHRHLTATEAARARSMITRSGNDAASALWAELGRRYLWLRLSRPSAGVSRPARRPWPTGSPPSRRSPRRSTTTSTPPRHRPSRHPGHSRRRKLQTSTSPHPDSVRYERVEIRFPILRGRRLDDLRFEDPGSPFFGVALVLPRRMQIIEDLRARGYSVTDRRS